VFSTFNSEKNEFFFFVNRSKFRKIRYRANKTKSARKLEQLIDLLTREIWSSEENHIKEV